MSREKGRTRQGKQKKDFFCKKNHDAKNATPSKHYIRVNKKRTSKAQAIVQARKEKMNDQEQAGVITKPFSVKKKVFLRVDLDTSFDQDAAATPNENTFLTELELKLDEESPSPKKQRPGFIAASLNRLSALSPLKLVPLKNANRQVWTRVPTPSWRRRAMTMNPPPKTPGSVLSPAPASSIVKLWQNHNTTTTPKSTTTRSSLLPPPAPPSSEHAFFEMPSVMTASPVVKTWTTATKTTTTPRSALASRRHRLRRTMTPGTLFADVHLSSLFAKGVSLRRGDDNDDDKDKNDVVTKTPGRSF